MQKADEAYALVSQVRPSVLERSTRIAEAILKSTDIQVSPIRSPTELLDKLNDFYLLRHNLCQTAADLPGVQMPPPMYMEDASWGYYMKAAKEDCKALFGDVLQLVTEVNVILKEIREQDSLLKKGVDDTLVEERRANTHLWRMLSVAVVAAQCLQLMTAYYNCNCSKQPPQYVGITTLQTLFDSRSALQAASAANTVCVARIAAK